MYILLSTGYPIIIVMLLAEVNYILWDILKAGISNAVPMIKRLLSFPHIITVTIKNRLRLLNSPAPQSLRGKGFLFLPFSFIIVLWIYSKTFLLIITKKFNILSILDLLLLKTSSRWFIVGIHPMAVPCLDVLIAGNLNFHLFTVIPGSALPVAQSILWTEPPLCLSNWSNVRTDTAFLPSMKT